jgi:hypothetical protein
VPPPPVVPVPPPPEVPPPVPAPPELEPPEELEPPDADELPPAVLAELPTVDVPPELLDGVEDVLEVVLVVGAAAALATAPVGTVN